MSNKRDVSIQLLRIVAMFMIVFDHLVFYIGFPYKSIVVQITNSGVFIFLLISGYLYGQRKIENWKNWFINRIIKICIPVWIFVFVDLIIEQLIYHNFNIKNVFIYLFNVEGFINGTQTLIPLWFITLILICYLITPVLQKVREKSNKSTLAVITIIILVVQVLMAYVTNIGMVYGHKLSWCILALLMYGVGYYVGDGILNIKNFHFFIYTLATGIVVFLTIYANKILDGKIIYNDIVVWYGIIVVDLWISITVYKIGRLSWTRHFSVIINYLDKISFEFYLVHYLIILVATAQFINKITMKGYMLLTIALSILAGTVLHYISKPVTKVLKQKLIKG